MRGVFSETGGVLYALLPVILLGTSAGLAVEPTGVSAGIPVRDEVALRVPLGVRGFAPEDDGEIAAFPLEVRP